MKKLALLLVMLLVVPVAFAQRNGDALLTDDGALYTASVEWTRDHPEMDSAATSFIVLTARESEGAPKRLVVPATLSYGSNSNPALAYDAVSKTLFVFWQFSPNAMSSELRFVSLGKDGKWSAPSTFGTAAFHFRRNLRIALTHQAVEKGEGDELKYVHELNVHATWWEETASSEAARYAMLTIHEGEVAAQVFDPVDFVKPAEKPAVRGADFNPELLRYPSLFESADGRTVDLLFGSVSTNDFHRVTITPIGNGRVRIPVGGSDHAIDPPAHFAAHSTDRIDAISPNPSRIAFYFEGEGSMHYIIYRDGQWTAERSVKLGDGATRETVSGAVRRLVGSQ